MSQQDCKHGAACKFRAAGKCLYRHPAMHLAVPAKKKAGAQKQNKKGAVLSLRPKLTSDTIIHMGRSVMKRRVALEAMKALTVVKTEPLPVIKGFVVVPDVKTSALPTSEGVAALQELYDSELKMARGAIGQMYGMKAILFNLPSALNFVSTVTSGIVSAVFVLDASQAIEWSSLAALFDEYRFQGGRYEFWVSTPTLPNVLGTSSGINANSILALGYDPSDATALASTGAVAQLEQHKLYFPRPLAASAAAVANTYAGVFNNTNGKPMVFTWKTARATEFTGNGGAVGPGQWKATAGNVSSFPDGTLKPFYQSGDARVTEVLCGVTYWHIEFRMRT